MASPRWIKTLCGGGLPALLTLGMVGGVVACQSTPGREVILTPVAVRASITPSQTGVTAPQTLLTILPPTATPRLTSTPVIKKLAVHINGAVARPGVYTFNEGSRVVDALTAAGGLLPTADPDQVNQAALLRDEQLLYIPFRGTPPPVSPPPVYAPSTAAKATVAPTPSGPINLNTATKAELDTLPGIGPTLADRILEYRQKNGPFQRPEDLKKVTGIGDRLYESIKDRITAP